MIASVHAVRTGASYPVFGKSTTKLYHDIQRPPPLSTAIFVRQWSLKDIVRVDLWWKYKLIGDLPTKSTESPVRDVNINLRSNTTFIWQCGAGCSSWRHLLLTFFVFLIIYSVLRYKCHSRRALRSPVIVPFFFLSERCASTNLYRLSNRDDLMWFYKLCNMKARQATILGFELFFLLLQKWYCFEGCCLTTV